MRNSTSAHIHRVDTSEMAAGLAISWIEAVATPPRKLSDLVAQYRDFRFRWDIATGPEADRIDQAMETISARLTAAAERIVRHDVTYRAMPRLHRPIIGFQQRCNEALAQRRPHV